MAVLALSRLHWMCWYVARRVSTRYDDDDDDGEHIGWRKESTSTAIIIMLIAIINW